MCFSLFHVIVFSFEFWLFLSFNCVVSLYFFTLIWHWKKQFNQYTNFGLCLKLLRYSNGAQLFHTRIPTLLWIHTVNVHKHIQPWLSIPLNFPHSITFEAYIEWKLWCFSDSFFNLILIYRWQFGSHLFSKSNDRIIHFDLSYDIFRHNLTFYIMKSITYYVTLRWIEKILFWQS